ncbi:MAG: hypothetical protein PVG83_07120 [Acidimicrobiia bacterium]|jgi:hypothetical protein
MQTAELSPTDELRRVGRRFGFGLAVAINVALLYVVQNLASWDVLPFLTTEFDEVVPWISVSLIVSILANVVYMVYDRPMLRPVGDILTNLASLAAAWRVFQVFPFDFSDYAFPWDVLTRVVLIVGIVGTFVGVIVALTKLANESRHMEKGESDVGPA